MTTAVQINELYQDFISKICKKIRENSYKKMAIGHCRDLHSAPPLLNVALMIFFSHKLKNSNSKKY